MPLKGVLVMSNLHNHIHAAASSLHNAVQEGRRETQELQREIDRKKQEKKQRVDGLRTQITQRQALLTSSELDMAERADIMREIQNLESEISALDRQYLREDMQLHQAISKNERRLNNLSSKISQLERMAAA